MTHPTNDVFRPLHAPLCAAALAVLCGTLHGANPFAGSPASGDSTVEVSEYELIDLSVKNEDLGNVVEMLSVQTQKSILLNSNVSATVTANLYDKTLYEVLDAILNVNGFGFLERGEIIYVYTLEDLTKIEEASRKPIQRVIRLRHLNAADASGFVQNLLSSDGKITFNQMADDFSISGGTPAGNEAYALESVLVVHDYAEHVDKIEDLLHGAGGLDARPLQVLVKATILQTELNEKNAFGIDFSLLGNIDFKDFIDTGGPLSVANALQKGGDGSSGAGLSPSNGARGLSSTAGGTGGPSTFKAGVVMNDFAVFLRALDEITDFTVVSNPELMALNRMPATVLIGRKVGYLNTTSTETATTQSVEFLETGTTLTFRPFISRDSDLVRLELSPSVSQSVLRDTTVAGGDTVTIPDEITQELTTNIIVPDGSTAVLGGMFKEETTVKRRQVPFLGDIPLLSTAFRGNNDETARSEVIFMITPTIMNDEVLADAGGRAREYARTARAGAREGLLPWSRDRLTASRNVRAEGYIRAGEYDKALWDLRRSLELNPSQPEAVRLLEDLTGEHRQWPNDGMLNKLVNDRLEVVFGPPAPAAPAAPAASEASAAQPAVAEGVRAVSIESLRKAGAEPVEAAVVAEPVEAAVVAEPVEAAVVAEPVEAAVVAEPVESAVVADPASPASAGSDPTDPYAAFYAEQADAAADAVAESSSPASAGSDPTDPYAAFYAEQADAAADAVAESSSPASAGSDPTDPYAAFYAEQADADADADAAADAEQADADADADVDADADDTKTVVAEDDA